MKAHNDTFEQRQVELTDGRVTWWLMEAVAYDMWDSLDDFIEYETGDDVYKVTGVNVEHKGDESKVKGTVEYEVYP